MMRCGGVGAGTVVDLVFVDLELNQVNRDEDERLDKRAGIQHVTSALGHFVTPARVCV